MGESTEVTTMTEEQPRRKRGRPRKHPLPEDNQTQRHNTTLAGDCPTCGAQGVVYSTCHTISYCMCNANRDHKWSVLSKQGRAK